MLILGVVAPMLLGCCRCTQCDDDQHFLEPDGMVQKDSKLAALSTPVVMFTTQLTLSKQYDQQPGLGTRTATITA